MSRLGAAAGIGLLAVLLAPGMAAANHREVKVNSVSYTVSLAQDASLAGASYTVRGFAYGGATRGKSVVLLLHGLSYGYWAWDFPVPAGVTAAPYQYSIARYLAAHGYDAVAIDELGYGKSDHPPFPDSRMLTIPAYANMAHQIVQKLHESYSKVIIAGHSAGGEIANFEAGRYRDVDGLVDMSMCDVLASQLVITDIAMNDTIDATNDYSYFGNDVAGRTALMYAVDDAEPAIVAKDNAMANPTPTSEMQSISPQPAREMDPLVNAPVLILFSDLDAIFPPMCQQFQPLVYAGSPKVSQFHLPAAGHAFMLHKNAAAAEAALLGWLTGVAPSEPSEPEGAPAQGTAGASTGPAVLPNTGSGLPPIAPLLIGLLLYASIPVSRALSSHRRLTTASSRASRDGSLGRSRSK